MNEKKKISKTPKAEKKAQSLGQESKSTEKKKSGATKIKTTDKNVRMQLTNKKEKGQKVASTSSGKKTTKRISPKKEKEKDEKGVLVEAAENIEEGAKIVSEKAGEIASEVADKSTELAKSIFGKLKKGIVEAYEAGTKIADQISQTAHDYGEKYKNISEIRKLKTAKEKSLSRLGALVYEKSHRLSKKDQSIPIDEELKTVIQEIRIIENTMVEIGKKLDTSKNKKS
ncbi:MAG: hypothetical protein Kow0042_24450 [Calditrichia bacterium]